MKIPEILTKDFSKTLMVFALIPSVFSVIGSLYFSEYAGYAPCDYCWWQRVAMYPLVPILAIALWRNDKQVYWTTLPFLAFGLVTSFWHNIMYYRANFFQVGEYVAPCRVGGASCTERYVEYFGFVTIPLLAFFALVFITTCMVWLWKREGVKKA